MPTSSEGDDEKLVAPFVRKQMAQSAATVRQISVRRSCQLFGVSQTCYRYAAKSRDENKVVADSLIALSLRSRTWGFGLMFLYLRKVQHKRVVRAKPEPLEVFQRVKIPVGQWISCMTIAQTAEATAV